MREGEDKRGEEERRKEKRKYGSRKRGSEDGEPIINLEEERAEEEGERRMGRCKTNT